MGDAWDQPMIYSDQTVEDAPCKEDTFKSFFRGVKALVHGDYVSQEVGWRMGNADRGLAENGATYDALH